MDDNQRAKALADIAELQAIVDENDESGWAGWTRNFGSSPPFLCEENYCNATGGDLNQSELLELRWQRKGSTEKAPKTMKQHRNGRKCQNLRSPVWPGRLSKEPGIRRISR